MTNTINADLRGLLDEVDADRLIETTRAIAQWERLSGSEEEKQAFDFIESEMQRLGFMTQRYNPVCLTSLPVSASLTVAGNNESLHCITHSFSTSTNPEGIELDLVYAGAGRPEDYEGLDVRGKAVLVEGLATPNKVRPAEDAGVAAVIHNSGPQIHEMTISPVWGSPTPDTEHLLPTIPHISVGQESADRLRELLAGDDVKVRITATVDTGWRPLPVLVANMPAKNDRGMHVLLSGHVDSWYYGAMDNGSANASMIECARLLSERRDSFRRGLRLAFWSGHSHARYATSTWYADEFWNDLHYLCVAHVNIDSPGGVGATDLTGANTMAETYPMARDLFKQIVDADLEYARIGRLGDQSFWGAGVPSFYCSISRQPAEPNPTGISALLGRGGGLGWWWHTADDTMDKLDPEFLARDCRILLATVYRLCTDQRLALDHSHTATEMRDTLRSLQEAAGEDIDLQQLVTAAEQLRESAETFGSLNLGEPLSDDEAAFYNGTMLGVSRILMPANYTISGAFDHDPALPAEPLPGLQPMRNLPALRDDPDRYYPWVHKLRRERNRVLQALQEARALIDQTVAVFQS